MQKLHRNNIMKINSEFFKKVILILLGTITVVGSHAYLSYVDAMMEKKVKTKHLVESTHGIIKYYYGKVQEGSISVDIAKKEAMAAIKNSRYGANEYFWIQNNEKIPTMLMHATTPSLEGKLLDNNKFDCVTDIQMNLHSPMIAMSGITNLFITISKVVKENGEGFIFYEWTKPRKNGSISKETYPKVSYFKEFKEWNWIVGSGVYVDDVKNDVIENLMKTLLLGLILILIWLKFRK